MNEMKLKDAVLGFDRWERPWEFEDSVRKLVQDDPGALSLLEDICLEANRREHWMQTDLVLGCKVTQNALRKKFPDIEDDVLAPFVRAASYSWR